MEPGTSSLRALWEKLIKWPLFIHLAMALTLPWIATSLGLGFALVPILFLAIIYLHTVDQIQKSQFAVFLRGRIEEEAVRRALVTNIETAQWLNGLLLACWPSVEIFLSSEIATILQSKLDHNRPKIVQKIIVDRFRLGSCPPIIQSVKVIRHPDISSSSGNMATAVLEMDFSFVAAKDMASEITASLNFGLAGKLFADHVMIVGRLRMCFKFIPFHPFVSQVSIAFVSMPQLGISIRPLSSSSVAVTDLPMVASWVTKVAEAIVETSLVDPFSIELDFVEMFYPEITPFSRDIQNDDDESIPFSRSGIGASSLKHKPFYIILEIIEGKDLEAKDRSGYSDPYVTIKFNKMKFKTSIKKQTLNPIWHETFRLKVTPSSNLPNCISLRVRDHDTFGKDDELGRCDINLDKLDLKYGKKQDMWTKLREVKSGDIHISINMVYSYDKKEASDGSKKHQKNRSKQPFPFTSPTSKHSSNNMHSSRKHNDYSNLDHDISPSTRAPNIPAMFGEDYIVTDGDEVGASNYNTTFDKQKGEIPIKRTLSGSILFSSRDDFSSNSFK